MVCVLKINNAVSANTKFSQDELEKMEINSGLNPNGGKKELYVPRIILKYETNEIVTCHQNDTNFSKLLEIVERILV